MDFSKRDLSKAGFRAGVALCALFLASGAWAQQNEESAGAAQEISVSPDRLAMEARKELARIVIELDLAKYLRRGVMRHRYSDLYPLSRYDYVMSDMVDREDVGFDTMVIDAEYPERERLEQLSNDIDALYSLFRRMNMERNSPSSADNLFTPDEMAMVTEETASLVISLFDRFFFMYSKAERAGILRNEREPIYVSPEIFNRIG